MLSLRVFSVAAFAVAAVATVVDAGKVICYYDGWSYHREGVAKTSNITEAATLCDQLYYGYYKINSDYELETSYKYPYVKGANIATANNMKAINPNLKVLLVVGGNVPNKKSDRALSVVETPEKRTTFINSVHKTIMDYNYDGVDLGWQWPESFREEDKPIMETGFISSVKGLFGLVKEKFREEQSVYREGFSALVRELKAVLKPDNKILSISALPHVNTTAYFDLANLKEMTDQFVLHTYDYRTPQYFPKLADYSAPLHFKNASRRHPSDNVEATVAQWLSAGVPSEKLIMSIPTFGRAWEVFPSSEELDIGRAIESLSHPPCQAQSAAEAGTYTKTKGLVTYYEVCPHLVNYSPNQAASSDSPAASNVSHTTLLHRVTDAEKRLGSYCFRVPGLEKGVWISYEEPETATVKAAFAKLKKLGGVAVVDLSLDDFRGMCTGSAFPILKAVKQGIA
uniref:Imaginal disc growth factor n=1 Tax=Bemisia tabaci TaxID=7038 RepID=A0A8K1P8C8_BEMTA|nr:imaginal disc growth factor [Bemisia tabaci]